MYLLQWFEKDKNWVYPRCEQYRFSITTSPKYTHIKTIIGKV